MAADAFSASLTEASAALVEMTDPVGLARVSSETGSAPLSTRLLLKIVKAANDLVRRSDGSINRRLADLMEFKVPASGFPDRHGVSSKDVVIDTQTRLWVRVFFPPANASTITAVNGLPANTEEESRKKRRVIFHFHGGGFAVLSADGITYDIFCRQLCRRSDAVVISVNYRRAPEHRYPVAYDDCYAALGWLQQGFHGDLFKPYDLDLSQCVLLGDSAGANIVHHVGCRWAERDGSTVMPPASTCNSSLSTPSPLCELKIVAHVLLFPFFGGEERTPSEVRLNARNAPLVSLENMDWHWRAFLPPNSNRNHPASNVLGPNAPDLSSLPLPPSLIAIAEFDMLKDWQLRYAQGLARASKPVRLLYYVGGVHCFHIVTNSKLSSHMLSDIVSFINDGVSKQNSTA